MTIDNTENMSRYTHPVAANGDKDRAVQACHQELRSRGKLPCAINKHSHVEPVRQIAVHLHNSIQ